MFCISWVLHETFDLRLKLLWFLETLVLVSTHLQAQITKSRSWDVEGIFSHWFVDAPKPSQNGWQAALSVSSFACIATANCRQMQCSVLRFCNTIVDCLKFFLFEMILKAWILVCVLKAWVLVLLTGLLLDGIAWICAVVLCRRSRRSRRLWTSMRTVKLFRTKTSSASSREPSVSTL